MQLPSVSEDDRYEEQHKYGIFYDDEYDYLQHLKEPGTAVLEPVGFPSGPLASNEVTDRVRVDNKENKVTRTGSLVVPNFILLFLTSTTCSCLFLMTCLDLK